MTYTEEMTSWHKSSHSNATGDCIEVGSSAFRVGIRDTKDRSAGTLAVSRAAWAGFLTAIKTGELPR